MKRIICLTGQTLVFVFAITVFDGFEVFGVGIESPAEGVSYSSSVNFASAFLSSLIG